MTINNSFCIWVDEMCLECKRSEKCELFQKCSKCEHHGECGVFQERHGEDEEEL